MYHIAATYREAGQPDSAYRAINVDGTRNVLEAAARAGAPRVVHCSTGGVHGHIEHPPANEDAPFNPGDVYQETKLEAEQLAREYGRTHGSTSSIARPIGIYGPGDTRFLKMFRGLARGRFPMLGSGEVFYHLTFIDDLVEGFRLCGEVPAAAGRTYILAGPRYTTLNELVRLIATELKVDAAAHALPVWPFWTAGLLCEADVRAAPHRAAALSTARGLLHEEPRVRHDAAREPSSASLRRSICEEGIQPHGGRGIASAGICCE